jgi:hypothetical protein
LVLCGLQRCGGFSAKRRTAQETCPTQANLLFISINPAFHVGERTPNLGYAPDETVDWCKQAIAQVCAFSSPFLRANERNGDVSPIITADGTLPGDEALDPHNVIEWHAF